MALNCFSHYEFSSVHQLAGENKENKEKETYSVSTVVIVIVEVLRWAPSTSRASPLKYHTLRRRDSCRFSFYLDCCSVIVSVRAAVPNRTQRWPSRERVSCFYSENR